MDGIIQLLTPQQAAKSLGVSTSFLAKSRLSGRGPAYIKVGRRVMYQPVDLQAYIASRQRHSTSDSSFTDAGSDKRHRDPVAKRLGA